MPPPGTVLDGSWKEELTYGPPKEETLKERELRIENHRKTYSKMSYEEAAKWVDATYYSFTRQQDGLKQSLRKKEDGTWGWFVKMEYTDAQQRYYDYICTM